MRTEHWFRQVLTALRSLFEIYYVYSVYSYTVLPAPPPLNFRPN